MKNDNSLLVSAGEAAAHLGVSERYFHELRARAEFPAPRELASRCLRWLRADLDAYAAGLPKVVERKPEPEQLRRKRERPTALSAVAAGQEREAA